MNLTYCIAHRDTYSLPINIDQYVSHWSFRHTKNPQGGRRRVEESRVPTTCHSPSGPSSGRLARRLEVEVEVMVVTANVKAATVRAIVRVGWWEGGCDVRESVFALAINGDGSGENYDNGSCNTVIVMLQMLRWKTLKLKLKLELLVKLDDKNNVDV